MAPLKLNFKGLEMLKWNIATEREENPDERNVVICLVIIFTPGVWVIKMSKMDYFCIFCWW